MKVVIESIAASLKRERGHSTRLIQVKFGAVREYRSPDRKNFVTLLEIAFSAEYSFRTTLDRCYQRMVVCVLDGELLLSRAIKQRGGYFLAKRPLMRMPLADPRSLPLMAKRLKRLVGVTAAV